jgi:hypothetical protein
MPKAPAHYLKGSRFLTAKKVLKIRADYEKGKKSALELASLHGVTVSNIYLIANRRTWKHI